MGRHGAYIGNNHQIGINALLFAGHFCMTNQPILLYFTLDRIAGFIEEITFPNLIALRLTPQMLLLVIRSVLSDEV